MSYQNLAIMMLVTDVGELKFGLLKTFFVIIEVMKYVWIWKFNMEEYTNS